MPGRESYLEKPTRKGGVRGRFGLVLFVLFCFARLLFLQRTDVQLFLLSSPASSSWNFWHHQKALCNSGKPSLFQLIPHSKLKGPQLPGCLTNLVIQKHFIYYPSATRAHQNDSTLCPGRQEGKFHPPTPVEPFSPVLELPCLGTIGNCRCHLTRVNSRLASLTTHLSGLSPVLTLT